jgi:hypothetical protein
MVRRSIYFNNTCTDVLILESGELFALSRYTSTNNAVEPVLDSSRYFVLRVEGEGGRKAYIGMGFEERGDAQVIPFPLCLTSTNSSATVTLDLTDSTSTSPSKHSANVPPTPPMAPRSILPSQQNRQKTTH